jgi:hypothetical protein
VYNWFEGSVENEFGLTKIKPYIDLPTGEIFNDDWMCVVVQIETD